MPSAWRKLPSGDGDDVEWNWTSGIVATRWEAVFSADADEQYIFETAFNNRCSVALTPVPVVLTSIVTVTGYASASCPYNPATPQINLYTKLAANRDHKAAQNVGTSFGDYNTIHGAWANAPDGGAWDQTKLDATQLGVRHKAVGGVDDYEARVTEMYIDVVGTMGPPSPGDPGFYNQSVNFLVGSLVGVALLGGGLAGNARVGAQLARHLERASRGTMLFWGADEYRVLANSAAALAAAPRYSR